MVSVAGSTLRTVPAVDRAVLILQALGASGAGQRLSDLSRDLGLNKSTAYQILQALERHGLVERDAESLRYRLGYGVLELASAVLERLDLRAAARPSLRWLVAETGQTAFLGVRDAQRIVIVDKEDSPADLKITSPVGRRIPLTAGSFGKIVLAYADPAEVDALLAQTPPRPFTARTVTDPAAFSRILAEARQRGYALDDEEYLDGVRGISAPVLGPDGELVAALAVVGFTSAMADDRLPAMIEATMKAGRAISKRVGAMSFPSPPTPLPPGARGARLAPPVALPQGEQGADLPLRLHSHQGRGQPGPHPGATPARGAKPTRSPLPHFGGGAGGEGPAMTGEATNGATP